MKMALAVSITELARNAEHFLRQTYSWVDESEADLIVALGGDGFMLQTLHAMMAERRVLPVFGMNLGTIGFLMNEYQPDRLVERINAARHISFHPLSMKAVTVSGKTVNSPAINEVRSEEHTSELQSLMRISYAVFCLKNKKKNKI